MTNVHGLSRNVSLLAGKVAVARRLTVVDFPVLTAGSTALLSLLLTANPAWADDPLLLHDGDGLTIRAHLQAGINAVGEQNMFWNFSKRFAPVTKYDPDGRWVEGYLMPAISFTADLDGNLTAYGKVSVVASGTYGIDAFNAGNTGRVTLEEGYLGLRSEDAGGHVYDISVGPRAFKVGTGMLIANGGSSGFERGALKLGPRKAWEFATIGRYGFDNISASAFYLDANELPDTDSGTTILGADLRYDGDKDAFAGITLGHILTSNSPYPKAAENGLGAPTILPGARDGLTFVNLYGRMNPLEGTLDGLFVSGDFAYEWNPAIDLEAWAGRAQIGYTFSEVSWAPTISYTYQTFSGDDPSTSKLERFDPLYYEGSPSAWSTGSKSSMYFLNSNVNAHQIALQVKPSEADTLTLRYSHISANRLRSPLQFGQGTRLELIDGLKVPSAGVIHHHLADDIYLEYGRMINRNTFLTGGVSVSFPGAGIDSIIKSKAPLWSGAFVNVVVNF